MDADGNRYGPYDTDVTGSEAEAFTEDAWFDHFSYETGVVSGGDLTFTGLTATLSPIDARAHGSHLVRDDPWSGASPATTTGSPRRDLLVARRQRTAGEGESAVPGKTFLAIVQGTPAATPADPTHDEENDEPLWSWEVPASGGTVVTAVRDLRRPVVGVGHVVGAVAGAVPPFGTKTWRKVWTGSLTMNAFGDNTIFFPGGPFPHGVVSIEPVVNSTTAYRINSWGAQLERVNVRGINPNGTAAAGVSIPMTVTVEGW